MTTRYIVTVECANPHDGSSYHDSASAAWQAYRDAKRELFMADRRGRVTIAQVLESADEKQIAEEMR